MRCQILTAIALFLQLQSSAAVPVNDDSLQAVKRDNNLLTTRCMSQSDITTFQAHWPKLAGHGPVLNACSSSSSSKGNSNSTISGVDTAALGTAGEATLNLRASEIDALAKRYFADERSTQGDGMEKRCMTESQISAFQAAWPKNAGLGPALISCST